MLIKKVRMYNLQTFNNYAGGRVWFYDKNDNKISIGSTLISNSGSSAETDLATMKSKTNYNNQYTVYNGFRTDLDSITSVYMYSSLGFGNTDKTQYFQIEFKTPIEIKYMRYIVAASGETYTKSADIDVTFANGVTKTVSMLNANSVNGYIVRIDFPLYDVVDTVITTTDTNNLKNLSNISALKIDTYEDDETIIRYALSVDSRNTWNVFKNESWSVINLGNLKTEGNTTNELTNISIDNLKKLVVDGSNLDFATILSTNSESVSPVLKSIKIFSTDSLDPQNIVLNNDIYE